MNQMKIKIVAAVEKIAGDRLTPAEREHIADEAIAIVNAANMEAAKAVLDVVQKTAEETKT